MSMTKFQEISDIPHQSHKYIYISSIEQWKSHELAKIAATRVDSLKDLNSRWRVISQPWGWKSNIRVSAGLVISAVCKEDSARTHLPAISRDLLAICGIYWLVQALPWFSLRLASFIWCLCPNMPFARAPLTLLFREDLHQCDLVYGIYPGNSLIFISGCML